MKRFARNNGFTLVELMVTILVASIVTLSATTILLLGVRIMHKSNQTAERQNTTRVLLTAIEDLAAEGTITEVRSEKGPNEDGTQEVTVTWQVLNGTKAVFSFDRAEKTIYTGAGDNKAPLLTEVQESSVEISGKVLTFSVTTDTGKYDTSINCRMLVDNYRGDQTGTDLVDELLEGHGILTDAGSDRPGRNAFLKALASQYGSRGYIMDEQGRTNKYYTGWFVDGFNEANRANGWNENTPWCATFVSWVMVEKNVYQYLKMQGRPENVEKWFAYVDDPDSTDGIDQPNYRKYLVDNNLWQDAAFIPQPGDLIFFNTDDDDTDADHMGVVLWITDDKIYTIEGNSYNRVRVRDYERNTSNGVMGYGVLNWQ